MVSVVYVRVSEGEVLPVSVGASAFWQLARNNSPMISGKDEMALFTKARIITDNIGSVVFCT